MKLFQVGAAVVLLASVAGCGMFGEKRIDYRPAAGQVPALEVPPDLTRPVTVDTYKVPQLDSVKPAAGADKDNAQTRPDDISLQVEETGVSSILIKAQFDKSWRRVGLALEQLKLELEDKDRSKGIYFLRAIKAGSSLNLPKETTDTPASYRVLVKDAGLTCSVTVIAADGISDAASKLILDAVYKNIQP